MQALILCQRYTDAHSACDSLLPGVDKLYLQAQAGWRAGSLKDALAALQAAQALVQSSPKCSQLIDVVAGVMQHDDAATAAFDEGELIKHLEEADPDDAHLRLPLCCCYPSLLLWQPSLD